MKTDRLSSASTRAAAVLLAGLLLAAGFPASGQIVIRFGGGKGASKDASKGMAGALAQQVAAVRNRFNEKRRALPTVQGPGGGPAYARQEVAGLIDLTGKDLAQAIEKVGEPGLDALRAWADEELRRVQEELAAAGQTASSAGFSAPRAVATAAVTASLRRRPLPGFARASSAPRQETIAVDTSRRLLDQVSEVVGRIFVLAAKDDLEVKLWVGSTPAPQATFRFWSQGKVGGVEPTPVIVRTNGKRDHVLRGLYSYRASLTRGQETELVQYTTPGSERLDLVNESSFFCCRFSELYCHHVANEKECRP